MSPAELALVVSGGIFGLAFGSFCTVVVWRVPRGESVVSPGSACVHCGVPVPPWLNVPVLAWLLLRGRARCCGEKIPALNPIVEAGTAVLWALMAVAVEPAWLLVAVLPFAAGAVCVTAIDLAHYRIPISITRVLSVLAMAAALLIAYRVDEPPAGLGWAALWVPPACGAAASAALWALRRLVPQGMGRGDVLFAFPVGVVAATTAGAGAALVAMAVAFASASVVGVTVVVVRARRGQRGRAARRVPFGPHLALGALVAVVWGASWWNAYADLLG